MGWLDQRKPYVQVHRDDLGEVFADQAEVVQSVWQQNPTTDVDAIFDRARWSAALRDRLHIRNRVTAIDFGRDLADQLDAAFDPSDLDAFLLPNAERSALNINDKTIVDLQAALLGEEAEEAIANVFAILLGSRTDRYAESGVTTSANFGRSTAADQAGVREKTWTVNSGRPRSIHAEMNGESVPIFELFSNGMRWPGDPSGGADNNANCRCSVDFT